MSKIAFVGDFAWPSGCSVDVSELGQGLSNCNIVANLEGSILADDPRKLSVRNKFKFNLNSDPTVIELAKKLGVVAFGLANNHIGDYEDGIDQTVACVREAGLKVFGTLRNESACVPSGCTEYDIIGACSPNTELHRRKHGDTVAEFHAAQLLQTIRDKKTAFPNHKIVVYVHWGFELATYPLPADREWARIAAEAGADYIIGHHPHVVQGIEWHSGCLIAYSVGNFLLPHVMYRDRKLSYSDPRVCDQISVVIEDSPSLVWHKYNSEGNQIRFMGESAVDDDRIKALTPYAGMSDPEYLSWYRNYVMRNESHGLLVGRPLLASYFGPRGVHSKVKTELIRLRQNLRKVAIATNLHKPYNWL